MSAYYLITPQGLDYLLADAQQNSLRSLLFRLLCRYADQIFDFPALQESSAAGKSEAFQQLCQLMQFGYIQMTETEADHTSEPAPLPSDIPDQTGDGQYLIADCDGLLVLQHGLQQNHAIELAAEAADYVRSPLRRARTTEREQPLTVDIVSMQQAFSIKHLHTGKLGLLFINARENPPEQSEFVHLMRFFCQRYEYA